MKTYYLRGLLVSAMAPLGIPSFNVGQRRLKGLDGMIFVRGGGFNEPSKHSRVVFLPAETGGVNGPSELGKGEEVDWNQNEETPPPNRQLWDIQKFKERSNILETSYSVPLTPKVRDSLILLRLMNQYPLRGATNTIHCHHWPQTRKLYSSNHHISNYDL